MSKQTAKDDPIELDLPDGVADARQAVEMLRAWIADGSMMLSLNADAFGERVVDWGRILGEIGHHVARSAKLNGYMSEHEALQAVRQGFDAAMQSAQPTTSGKVRGRVNH
ncbi:MAG TPA: DUF5076 domain-containing protein [Hyphomicrobium sp.]|nr:DUF5076 domain-containing protein [Hyphomicrobium sp.]